MSRTKFGVIGLGWFGEKHCEALAEVADVELYALCTRNPSRLSDVATRFGVTQVFTDYREMLRDTELEAVSIVTMWDQHAPPALAALAAGKHVFLEKPMASTAADCEQIVLAAGRARGSLMVGHICRFNPRYAAAQEAIAAGRIGRILSMSARRNIPAAVTAGLLDKIGPIIGDGVHDTDLMLWFSRDRIVSAYAQSVNVRGMKYPDLGWTMYRFAGGAIGILENIWCLPDRTPFQIDERMEIIGTTGSIHIQETQPNFSVSDGEGWHSPDTTYWPTLHGRRAGALVAELDYFVRCIRAGERPTVITPGESLEAVRACLAAEESARTGLVVRVEHSHA